MNRQEELGERILKSCRSDLYRRFPYLDSALSGVDYRADQEIKMLGTDGDSFYFDPQDLLKCYAVQPEKVRRGYLHMLLHCICLHIFPERGLDGRLWNLACDAAVEWMMDREEEKRKGAFPETGCDEEKRGCYALLREALGRQEPSAEQIYLLLRRGAFPVSPDKMERLFSFDDHRRWWWNAKKLPGGGVRAKWEKLQGLTGQNQPGTSPLRGTQAGSEKEDIGDIEKSRHDYRKFLKRFAVLREETELDTESFDYIYYSYGMEHYKNLPLIEPLEYKEGHKLEELVIAIDTSGSCSADMVRQFLQESYSILGEKENFFKSMKVYFLQCDCVIQDAVCIRSREEWEKYCRNLKIQGRAGTDFRPVFRYIEQLREKRELKNLKALIYFTDGDGIYPREAPDYETAFVFVKKTEGMKYVPSWGRKLIAGQTGNKTGTWIAGKEDS